MEQGVTIAVAVFVVMGCLVAGAWHWDRKNKHARSDFQTWVRDQGGSVTSIDMKYSPSMQSNLYVARWTDANGKDQTTEFDVGLLGPVTFTRKA